MADIFRPQPISVYQSWIEAIKDVSEKLTTWETEFVDSIENQLASRNLTERQAEILERIYANKT